MVGTIPSGAYGISLTGAGNIGYSLDGGGSGSEGSPLTVIGGLIRTGIVTAPEVSLGTPYQIAANGGFAAEPSLQSRLAGIIFNETQSLSGPGLRAAQEQIGFVLQHRFAQGNTGGVAPSTVTAAQQQTPQYSQASSVAKDVLNGNAVDGATNNIGYNMRTSDSWGANQNYNPPLYPSMQFGPFANTIGPRMWIDIYGVPVR